MLIDAHAHLDGYDEFGAEALESALSEIEQHRIFTISNSMDLPSYRRNLEIGRRSTLILPVFGIHPWNAAEHSERLGELGETLDRSPLFGEVGLDHYFVKDSSAYPAQARVFEYFLATAREQGKIVNVHTKGAEREVLDLLDRFELPRVIIHWYSGPLDVFREMAGRGFYFTIGPELLRSKHIRAIASEIPDGRVLTETDNPGGPKSVLGRPGTPSLVQDVARALAEVRGVAVEALRDEIPSNLRALFGDDARLASFSSLLETGSGQGI
jgi:TatD DNase family protein